MSYDFALPDGLGAADFRRHPVRILLRDAAFHGARGLPSDAELEALGLTNGERGKLAEACKSVAATHAEGQYPEAWVAADRLAGEIIARLPETQRDPDYLEPLATAGGHP